VGYEYDEADTETEVCYDDDDDDWWDEYGDMESVDEIYGGSRQQADDAVARAVKYATDNMDTSQIAYYGTIGFMPWLEDYDSYWSADTPGGRGSSEYKTLATFVFRKWFSLHPKDLFDRYSGLLTLYLPHDKYVASGYERVVGLLIAAYDDMDGDSRRFEKMYDYMTGDYIYEDQMELVERYISDETKETFNLGHGEARELYVWGGDVYHCDSEARWAFSFWGRRNAERESRVIDIYNVLIAVRDLYDGLALAANEDEGGE
jgi:hypothetical protein